jgi:hypothetical protein
MEKWMKNFFVTAKVMYCGRCLETVETVYDPTLHDLVFAAGGHVCKQNPVEGENCCVTRTSLITFVPQRTSRFK